MKPSSAALAAALAFSLTPAQAAELVRRTTSVFGNFAVGCAALGDSGSFSQILFLLHPICSRRVGGAGVLDGVWDARPVSGRTSFTRKVACIFGGT